MRQPMNIDLKPFFTQYEELVQVADQAFEKVKQTHPECVTCKMYCSDCCHALFDITLIEAIYINARFRNDFTGSVLEDLLENSNRADRLIYQIKRRVYKDSEAGKDPRLIVEDVGEQRVRCPMLNDESMCVIYDYRPITCRLYGIPTSIGDESHTCGLSGFEKGRPYPTVRIDKIQDRLVVLSKQFTEEIRSKHVHLYEILVPLSMALLTNYDESYLGIPSAESTATPTE